MEGIKNDQGKAPLSWIPLTALEQEAQAFAFGAKKYDRHNFKNGMAWSRLLDAALRHINQFADGQDVDIESGLSHLAHSRACLSMLMYLVDKNKGTDDRYKEPDPEPTTEEILDQCPSKKMSW